MNKTIYLDANASMPPVSAAKQALLEALESIGNPSSPHELGRKSRKILDKARQEVANALGGQSKDLFFTSGASEGNRWLVESIIKAGRIKGRALQVLSSELEHPSLAKPLEIAAKEGLIALKTFSPGPLDTTLLSGIDIIIATAAHNESGILTDWRTLVDAAPESCILISDATQAMGRLQPLSERIDALVVSAHKMGGFPGVGAVLLRGKARGLPIPFVGGGQESGLRGGTEAVQLIAAFGAAAEVIEATRMAHEQLAVTRDHIENVLMKKWPFARLLGKNAPRLPNTTAITLAGTEGEALRIAIDMIGVCVGFGSACSALAPEPSPSLMALGLSAEEARATIRLSLWPGLPQNEIEEALNRLSLLSLKQS